MTYYPPGSRGQSFQIFVDGETRDLIVRVDRIEATLSTDLRVKADVLAEMIRSAHPIGALSTLADLLKSAVLDLKRQREDIQGRIRAEVDRDTRGLRKLVDRQRAQIQAARRRQKRRPGSR